MKEELYLWIRNLAVFYIFFTAVLNLVPDQKYEKYVRFFMGLLLIFMMSTPVFSILGKGPELAESFLTNFSKENRKKELQEFQNLQKVYLEKGYELELEQKIRESLKKKGIEVYKVKVNIKGEDTQAEITLEKEISKEEKGVIADELVEEWGLKENRIVIQTARNESGKMGDSLASGNTSGSRCDARFQ
nr:stage III sporulation protein AF [uncultured Blautia sp.]